MSILEYITQVLSDNKCPAVYLILCPPLWAVHDINLWLRVWVVDMTCLFFCLAFALATMIDVIGWPLVIFLPLGWCHCWAWLVQDSWSLPCSRSTYDMTMTNLFRVDRALAKPRIFQKAALAEEKNLALLQEFKARVIRVKKRPIEISIAYFTSHIKLGWLTEGKLHFLHCCAWTMLILYLVVSDGDVNKM